MMKINKVYPLDVLMSAVRDYERIAKLESEALNFDEWIEIIAQ